MENCYQILGVRDFASPGEILLAYEILKKEAPADLEMTFGIEVAKRTLLSSDRTAHDKALAQFNEQQAHRQQFENIHQTHPHLSNLLGVESAPPKKSLDFFTHLTIFFIVGLTLGPLVLLAFSYIR